MRIIGREREQKILENCMFSGRPEFIAVYGRRRVGKTYLIKEYFNQNFAFYTTGVTDLNMKGQLKTFYGQLREYGSLCESEPKDWFEAFRLLKELLEQPNVHKDPASNRIIVFIDELPWMDTPKSNFKSALDFFWNTWASSREDVILIVCGSATSWIIDNLLNDTGGLHNRITRSIHLQPFTLHECEELYQINNISLTRQQIVQSYMVFGGIPYYMNCMDRRLSMAQNIDAIVFNETGQLHYEFSRLYASLFKNSEKHLAIIRALAKKGIGMTRSELAKQKGISDGQGLTKALAELTQCGFIRKYLNQTKNLRNWYYQVIDPFTLFHLRFIESGTVKSWLLHVGTPGYFAWCGIAFELVCLLHVPQIKAVLGIQGVESSEYSWRSQESEPGAQIDLIIDRKDDVIDICEVKYAEEDFRISAAYEKQLMNKVAAFHLETGTAKALRLTMITSNGLSHNAHSGIIINEITGDELFLPIKQ